MNKCLIPVVTAALIAALLSAAPSPAAWVTATLPDLTTQGFDTTVYKMEVERFIALEGRAPKNQEEMVKSGYFFFVPPPDAMAWEYFGDELFLTSGSICHRVALPGTELFAQRQEQLKRTTLDAARLFSRTAGITPEDVETGRVSMGEWLTFKAYAASDEEWRQLCWARSLATTIAYTVNAYRQLHPEDESYPTLDELLQFAGPPNPAAWVSPLTGYKMTLQAYQSTMDPYYLGGGDSWELTVPLFGAGSQSPDAPSFFAPGKHFQPGEYMRVGYGPGTESVGGMLMVY